MLEVLTSEDKLQEFIETSLTAGTNLYNKGIVLVSHRGNDLHVT